MIEFTKISDFKNDSEDFKLQFILSLIKSEMSIMLDECEEAWSIEKYGTFILIEDKNEWKYEKGFLGLSEGIMKCLPEGIQVYVSKINSKFINLFRVTILMNNDYGIDIFFERENCPEDIFKYLTESDDIYINKINLPVTKTGYIKVNSLEDIDLSQI